MFHYLFPPLSIGLSLLMVIMEGMYLKTRNRDYEIIARFWTRIFAVAFAMGVVSGIPLSYEFGTNWSRFALVAGNVIGPLIGYEVLTALGNAHARPISWPQGFQVRVAIGSR